MKQHKYEVEIVEIINNCHVLHLSLNGFFVASIIAHDAGMIDEIVRSWTQDHTLILDIVPTEEE